MSKYTYQFGDKIIKTSKKLYKQNGVYGHKKGDFFEPCNPKLMLAISLAQLDLLTKKSQVDI